MPFSTTVTDRERDKFKNVSGETAVRVSVAEDNGSALEGDGLPAVITTSTTPQPLIGIGGPLADRKGVYIRASSANNFLGFSASVTSADGLELPNGQIIYIEAKSTASLYVIRASGTGTIRVWEVK